MRRTLLRTAVVLIATLALGVFGNVRPLAAANILDADDHARGGQHRPPQVLEQGFESHNELANDASVSSRAPKYSAWIVESSRFLNVPFTSFMPDRPNRTRYPNDPDLVDLPVNLGIIKAANGDITLYDSGWKQLSYIFDFNTSCCWADLRDQMRFIHLDPLSVKRIIIGHGHWDHAGQLSSFPNAVLYVQKEELRQIDFFLDYPSRFDGGHISAVNTLPPGCARTPVCGYPPQTVNEILGKLLAHKARIIDGRHEIRDADGKPAGLIIHPAFRGHTYGSQLLQVNTSIGQLVFGSDTYSSWEGIKDWNVANIQQTDTVQQFLAYEKCYALTSTSTGRINNCIAAHEPKSYSTDYPITQNWWIIPGGNCSRAAELVLSNGEPTHVPAVPDRRPKSACASTIPPHTAFQP